MGLLGIRLRRERRRFVRVPFAGTVRAAVIPPPFRNGIWHLTAENLSEGGLRLACGESCSVECGVLLDLDAPGSATPIRVVGKVVWVEQLPNEGGVHLELTAAEAMFRAAGAEGYLVQCRSLRDTLLTHD
jgi:hypothetical protein